MSFFFTIFSNEFEEKDLWRVFKRWERVLDVFIPERIDSRKQHFGFVRFQGLKDVNVLRENWI